MTEITPDTTFAIGWKGRYRIEGPAFIYVDHDTGQLSTSLATRRISSNRPTWILEPSATELYVNRICTSLPSSLRIA
jgi:hypothetical protein